MCTIVGVRCEMNYVDHKLILGDSTQSNSQINKGFKFFVKVKN